MTDDLAREQHLSNAVEEVHRVVIVKVIDDIRQPLVVHPPLPTLGLRPLAKTHLNLLREGQVLLLLESSQDGPERTPSVKVIRAEHVDCSTQG